MSKGGLVLIACDHGDLAASLRSLLQTIPRVSSISFAYNCNQAVAVSQIGQPALVLLDTNLPGSSVLECLRSIKRQSPQTLCLALSEHPGTRQAYISAGADDVLVKGTPAARLSDRIEQLLGQYFR